MSSLGEIRDFIKNAIPQIAAMDGSNEILGDSQRETSIMNRLLQSATPEEKDFVQKYLDGEKIVNSQEKNCNAVVKYTADGLAENSYFRRFLEDMSYYEAKYDEYGNVTETVSFNKFGEVIAKKKENDTELYFERTDGTYVLHQVGNEKDFYRIEKEMINKDNKLILSTGVKSREFKVSINPVYFAGKVAVEGINEEVCYKLIGDTVQLPQEALKKFPKIETILQEMGFKINVK